MRHSLTAPVAAACLSATLVVCSGCAHQEYAAGRRGTPPLTVTDPSIAHAEGTFQGQGGIGLFEQSWRPAEPRAVLVIMHGLKDHSSRYAETAEALARRGFAVHAFDLRGHGCSAGGRVWVDRFDQYVSDLAVFVDRVKAREPGKPVFVMGHSMGGAIVTTYVLTRKPDLKGLVLSAPALKPGADVSPFLIGTVGLFSAIAPGLGLLDLKNEDFSRDPAVVAAMSKDPLIQQGAGPARTASELLQALLEIGKNMEQVKLPFLVMHGTKDKLTNPEGSKELNARAGSTDKTLKIYEGLSHDLLHEPEKAQVLSDLTSWLDAHA